MWPHLQWVGDLLRASVLCMDFNRVAEAWRRVSSVSGFDVREGNGRLKNMLSTTKHQPPRFDGASAPAVLTL